jgi:Tfp pilus assembly protein FimT
MNQRNQCRTRQRTRGFSTLELLLVVAVSLVIAALAIPGFNQVQRTLRISGDARDLNAAINQAKLLAAADFTRARVYIDTGAGTANTFHVDVWDKTNGCWHALGDTANPCLVDGTTSPAAQSLSPGVTFGWTGVGAPPPNTQTGGIQQAPTCYHSHGLGFGTASATSCTVINSRGIPIVPASGAPTGNDAIYITDGTQVYAVTVSPTGISQVWANNIKGNANWYQK